MTSHLGTRIVLFCIQAFGYVWLTALVVSIVMGLWGIYLKEGFWEVCKTISPFNFMNWLVTVVLALPFLACLHVSTKLRKRIAAS